MLLLPLSREDGGPRAVPWLTIALVVLNVASLLAVAIVTDDGPVTEEVGRLVAYLKQHPYLEMSPRMARMLDEDLLRELGASRSAFLGSRALPSVEVFERERHQLAAHEESVLSQVRALPTQRWGFVPSRPWSLALVTSLFLHGGLLHLVGNLVFLWITAPFLEERLGRVAFAGLYLASGLGANAAHALRHPDSAIPLVGASGAIAGLMGAFVVYFTTTRIRFLLLPTPVVVTLPALVVFPLWLAEQMFLSRYVGSDSGIAFSAHVGGFLFGLGAGGVARMVRPEPAETPVRRASPAGDRAAFEEAVESGDRARIVEAGSRMIDRLRGASGADAAAFVEELRACVEPPPPARLWLAAAALLEREDAYGALVMYQEIVESEPASASALRALLRRAELLRRQGEVREARRILQQALAHPACTPSFKDSIERSLASLSV